MANMGKDKKFIRTSNSESAEILKKAGFPVISEIGGVYIFLNNGKVALSHLHGVEPTDMLYV